MTTAQFITLLLILGNMSYRMSTHYKGYQSLVDVLTLPIYLLTYFVVKAILSLLSIP